MTETGAETMRRAAKLMRERAGAATEGPWEHPLDFDVTHGYHMKNGRHIATWLASCDAGDGDIPEDTAGANADYIASMHPLVGLAVAGWLDEVAADRHAELPAWVESAAAAVARAYLGEVPA